MGKNRDLISILILVIIGMFIPFFGSLIINFGLDISNFDNWLKICSTFGYFLLIFAIELVVVILYFKITNKTASKKLEKYKSK